MKVENIRHLAQTVFRFSVVAGFLCVVFALTGCTAISFLLSEGPFEKKTIPAYNLKEQQDRKIMVWIECPYSANADFDVQEKLAVTYQLYMTEKAGFEPENIILNSSIANNAQFLDPKKVARSKGVGYLLLVQVDNYEADFLQVRDYYAGEMITRAILFDIDLDAAVWPVHPEGKMVHISVEMETKGRDSLISRLSAAAAHCTLRDLYPCDKLKYDSADERVSLQEAYEIETY